MWTWPRLDLRRSTALDRRSVSASSIVRVGAVVPDSANNIAPCPTHEGVGFGVTLLTINLVLTTLVLVKEIYK